VSRYHRPVTCFDAKVAGVTYDNRQVAIAKLRSLEPIDLVPEPDNPADPNAIKVCRRTGEQIGYLKRARARQLVEKLSTGHRCSAFVKRVSGGETHYASITVLVMSPHATDEQVIDWINRYDVLAGITLSFSPEGTLVATDDTIRRPSEHADTAQPPRRVRRPARLPALDSRDGGGRRGGHRIRVVLGRGPMIAAVYVRSMTWLLSALALTGCATG
jgi:hypothetical protein